jgi:general secretion pathway protein H
MHGFTLIELIVALAVAGLLLVAVPVSLSRAYDASEYRATVRQVLAGLKSARHQAMRTGAETVFAMHTEQRRFGSGTEMQHAFPDSLTVGMVVAEQDIDADGTGRIRFYPDGSATGGSIDILRDNGVGVRLRVDWMLGRISQFPIESEGRR